MGKLAGLSEPELLSFRDLGYGVAPESIPVEHLERFRRLGLVSGPPHAKLTVEGMEAASLLLSDPEGEPRQPRR